MQETIGEIVRKLESNYIRGNTKLSKYVDFDMFETINKIDAYLNSKHTTGLKDSQGRKKPFFNIVVSAANIWFRATDIDRKNIKIKASKGKDTIKAFLATVLLQIWMQRERFGTFLNNWGRVLSRYGSAVVKFVEKSDGLHPSVINWQSLIVDPINFDDNVKIEILELTEAELRSREGYDQNVVEELINATKSRETIDKQQKDIRSDYIKLYEVHGKLPLSLITDKDKDAKKFEEQMHVISFVGKRNGRKVEFQDFTLYKGISENPYMITHLIKAEDRTLSIGPVEYLFDAQWMQNHSIKSIKDQLDLASKLIFQTSDTNFVGQNALTAIETGDILIHAINQPLTPINNSSHDITAQQNFMAAWKQMGNEIVGVSEAMLGAMPKSGTAWRQTEALLQENYSLFELMTENKGLHLEDMLREKVLPYFKKTLNNSKEISAILESYDIERIDSKYLKNFSIQKSNDILVEKAINAPDGQLPTPEDQAMLQQSIMQQGKEQMNELGNQRFFKPSEIDSETWKEVLKGMEWDLEIDITGENKDYQSIATTLNTALQVVANPNYAQNKQAQMIVGKILSATGQLSPLEMSQFNTTNPVLPGGGSVAGVETLSAVTR